MESLKELYRMGHGPSSSHTMGPRKAANDYLHTYTGDSSSFEVELYGSLAATGRGHLTDKAITDIFHEEQKDIVISWYPDVELPFHPNGLKIYALDKSGAKQDGKTYYSIGGGKILKEGEDDVTDQIYPSELNTLTKILAYCSEEGIQLWEYVARFEGDSIWTYIESVWNVMAAAVERGIEAEGVLPGGLKLQRKACQVYIKSQDLSGPLGNTARAIAYALAVSEENASGGKIVTAPTCGSCGVLPGVLYYFYKHYNTPKVRLFRAMLTAGLIGNIAKTNGSISGAEVGCQGEVGVACAMASAAAAQLLGGSIYQIEYAAEMGLEHHLGLTCDPMLGMVQIPCIERNALACMRSLDHATYALLGDGRHKVSYDSVVAVMMETGQALPSLYRETSKGGLARLH